jgi:hypothetical protein
MSRFCLPSDGVVDCPEALLFTRAGGRAENGREISFRLILNRGACRPRTFPKSFASIEWPD